MRRPDQASIDILDLEVTLVGDDGDPLDAENLLCRFGGLCQQTHIDDLVGDLLLDDQLVFGIDGDLHVVATATRVCAAIARLSGSVSEIWLSPVWSSSASISL